MIKWKILVENIELALKNIWLILQDASFYKIILHSMQKPSKRSNFEGSGFLNENAQYRKIS